MRENSNLPDVAAGAGPDKAASGGAQLAQANSASSLSANALSAKTIPDKAISNRVRGQRGRDHADTDTVAVAGTDASANANANANAGTDANANGAGRGRGPRRRCASGAEKSGAAKSGAAKTSKGKSGSGARQRAPGGQAGRADLYDEVTATIIAQLEQGRVPWVQPWGKPECNPAGNRVGTGGAPTPGLPRNAVTSRAYSGINVLILWGAVIENGWPSQAWLTFRQARAAGASVRKGEHGTPVVYADRFTPEAEKERARQTGEDARTVAFLKRFTVFNVAQVEGLPDDLCPEPAPLPERELVPLAEDLIAASGVDFRIGGPRAFYSPGSDFVQVPPQPAFFAQIDYYRTCLHELCHATGHASRLNRKLLNSFGSKDYAREELVAEMGAAFLCASLGIVPTVRHADYIGSWLQVLREDNRAIFRAASQGSKAADWLLTMLAASKAGTPAASRAELHDSERRAAA